jgi:hypothetical protein
LSTGIEAFDVSWFWHALWIAIVVIPVTILWISCVFDIFNRRDLGAGARVLWLLGILVLPVFGSLLYLITRPHYVVDVTDRALGRTTLGQELSELDRLRTSGAISEHEFQVAKADALEKVPPQRAGAAAPSDASTAGQP